VRRQWNLPRGAECFSEDLSSGGAGSRRRGHVITRSAIPFALSVAAPSRRAVAKPKVAGERPGGQEGMSSRGAGRDDAATPWRTASHRGPLQIGGDDDPAHALLLPHMPHQLAQSLERLHAAQHRLPIRDKRRHATDPQRLRSALISNHAFGELARFKCAA
jgi:hypothetical protein